MFLQFDNQIANQIVISHTGLQLLTEQKLNPHS